MKDASIQWNLSLGIPLKRGHLSNKDTFSFPKNNSQPLKYGHLSIESNKQPPSSLYELRTCEKKSYRVSRVMFVWAKRSHTHNSVGQRTKQQM